MLFPHHLPLILLPLNKPATRKGLSWDINPTFKVSAPLIRSSPGGWRAGTFSLESPMGRAALGSYSRGVARIRRVGI